MRWQRSLAVVSAAAVAVTLSLPSLSPRATAHAETEGATQPFKMYGRPVPNYDLNRALNAPAVRAASPSQSSALEALRASNAALTARWNSFGGSPDVITDFASQPYPGTPEQAGRAFLADNAALFGLASGGDLRLVSSRDALGGHLLRFQQTFGGIDVVDGGVGLVMTGDNRVVMASGPLFRDVSVDTTPSISAEQAVAAAGADIARFRANLPQTVLDTLAPAYAALEQQAAPATAVAPRLWIYPTASGYRLVWKLAKFSANPFGLYVVTVDAHTGEIVARQDKIDFLQNPAGPYTADVYPKYPTITQELKDQGKISVDANGTPLGQERVTLRNFEPTNIVSGVNGTLVGTHSLVNNALATKQPFAQAAKGTWHFRVDDPTNFEARTNEQDQLAEPAEHQDEINAFFFCSYLVEYVDYLHVAGDAQHGGFGAGAFPDDYPNKTVPLPATVHIPNIYLALDIAGGSLPDPTDPTLAQRAIGLDNAFAQNLTGTIREVSGVDSPVVINPTNYGHGYYFNDLALEGTVPYHEGMHSITSPIAGLEGAPEGSALNEGQADEWAFTITDNPSLGDYVVQAYGIRNRYRALGRNPDSIAYVRSARSTLKYSDIGTLANADNTGYDFEEHYDGEIYMSTMWDVREMLNRQEPAVAYKRPAPRDGAPTKPVTVGTDTFERIFLGSMYVLGTTAPDTMVKARDALLVADRMLYSSDTLDPAAPGLHRALIENVFAAHELGVNAREVTGGQATISTQVSPFAASQAAPAAPQGVQVAPASSRTLAVSWQPVPGAMAYEVLKRKVGFEGRREPNGKREFVDGDAGTTGFRHVAYVDGSASSYEDRGPVHEIFTPSGLDNLFDHEYVVRAIKPDSTRQLGFSALSGSARPVVAEQNLTNAVNATISNVAYAGSVFSFDQTLTNVSGAAGPDKTIYSPVEFRVVAISDPTVTVRNPDQTAPSPTFVYTQTLPLGATSAAKRLQFNDPGAKLFTFDAAIVGRAYSGTVGGTGSQSGDGSSEPAPPPTYGVYRENFTGILPLGDPTGLTTGGGLVKEDYYADPNFKGITYADVPVTTKGDALQIDARLSSTLGVDMDFELRSADGATLIARSAGGNASERITAVVQPNTRYILRVVGWANGPADYTIQSDQLLPEGSTNANAGTVTPGSTTDSNTPATGFVRRLFRFTVNPLTKRVTVQLLR